MWDAIGIIGLLGTLVAIIGGIIMAIKKNPIWKRWIMAAGIAFVIFIVGIVNAPTDDTQTASSSNDQPVAKSKEPKVQPSPAKKNTELSNTGVSSNVGIVVQGFENTDTIGDNQYNIAKAQGVFKVVTMSITNNQKDSIVIDSDSFKLVDDQGREFSDSSEAAIALACSMGDHPEDFTFKELNPGMTITGVVIFDVPVDAQGFVLKAHGGMTGSEITLKVE